VANGARTHLTLYLTGSYLLLIVYASLYPLTGWRDSGDDALSFLGAPWPRYYTGFDLAMNVAAYLPFGFLCAAAMRRRLAGLPAWLLAALCGGALSLVLELLQSYLPNRIPSNLDLACNFAGALLGGGFGALWGAPLLEQGRLADLRRRLMMDGYGADIGVLLAAAWLMTQLSPESLLFGSGNLRQMLDLPPVQPFLAERFVDLETLIAAAGLLAAGLVFSMLLRRHARWLTLCLLCLALLVKTAAHALLMGPAAALGWITPRQQPRPRHRPRAVVDRVLPRGAAAARRRRAGAAAGHRDGQCRAGEPLSAEHVADLEPRPVPQFQRPDAAGVLALAFPRPALADDLPSEKK
jgi:VanZ family protein